MAIGMKRFETLLILFVCFPMFFGGAAEPDSGKLVAAAKKNEEQVFADLKKWYRLPAESRGLRDDKIAEIVGSLSDEEVIHLAKYNFVPDLNYWSYRRWGTIEPEAAIECSSGFSLKGNGKGDRDDGAFLSYLLDPLLGAFDGWASRDPSAAWKAFRDRNHPFDKSKVVDAYSSQFYESAMEKLAAEDASEALNAIITVDSDDFIKSCMLVGYSRSVREDRDWSADIERVLAIAGVRMKEQVRTGMLGNWLAADPVAAEKWFTECEIKDVSWEEKVVGFYEDGKKRTPGDIEKVELGFSRAVGFWAAKDFQGAYQWLESRRAQSKSLDLQEFTIGAREFFRRDSSSRVRRHFRSEMKKLPRAMVNEFTVELALTVWTPDSVFNNDDEVDFHETVRSRLVGPHRRVELLKIFDEVLAHPRFWEE